MKKIMFFILLASTYCYSQEISPYYPITQGIQQPEDFSSQLTYYDTNYICNNISEFLSYNMAMVFTSSDDSKLLSNGGTYIFNYADRFWQSGDKKLKITYSVGSVDGVFVVKNVKITGDYDRVVSFFVHFWKTTIKFNKTDVSLRMGQDVVKLFYNKGKPYIFVSNSVFKNIDEFKVHFAKLKKT